MQFNKAITYINENASKWLMADKSGKGYICPICGSGDGPNGTGITESPEKRFHYTCWRNCFTNASYVDILAIKNHIDTKDTGEVVRNACEELGLNLDYDYQSTQNLNRQAEKAADLQDFTEFFNECHKNINQTEYWKKRGLTNFSINKFNIGFCKAWIHPKSKDKTFTTERLIIPTGKGSYLARYTGDKENKCSKMKVGHTAIFNAEALDAAKEPIFVVEGEIDAMSIYEAEGEAIALGSVSMVPKFLRLLEDVKPVQPVIIALDNDEAGRAAQLKIKEQEERLKAKGIKLVYSDTAVLYGGHKDANEALIDDYFGFASRLEEEKQYAIDVVESTDELEKCCAFNNIDDFQNYIRDSARNIYIPTGFNELDEILEGGMHPGLYVVGAISSLGKTTFCLQLADQVAKQGRDVIIFSLEMSNKELMAKSISRLTCQLDVLQSGSSTNAKTMRGILDYQRYEKYSKKETDLIDKAWEEYKTFARHIFLYEVSEGITVKEIRNLVQKLTQKKGTSPVVIIDYLQILDAPENLQFLSDKQITDKNVKALKILSRDFNSVVIGISSFNRDNYSAPVNMASFKESGAIEYSSDVLIGLQYAKMEEFNPEAKDPKTKAQLIYNEVNEVTKKPGGVAEVQLKILKNRGGCKGSENFDFCPTFNLFTKHRGPEIQGFRKIGG